MNVFALKHEDMQLRVRLGYFGFSAGSGASQTLTLPGVATGTVPASTRNRLFGFTYGAELLYAFRPRVYGLGGAGVAYLQASRSGTVDLSSAGLGQSGLRYSVVTFSPYVCVGLGYRITRGVALEGRYQYTAMESQARSVSQPTASGVAAPKASFPGFAAPTLALGLVFHF
jgi:hypothetical protein